MLASRSSQRESSSEAPHQSSAVFALAVRLRRSPSPPILRLMQTESSGRALGASPASRRQNSFLREMCARKLPTDTHTHGSHNR
jgi:hypothetical protein